MRPSLNWFDRFVSVFSPQAAIKRAYARAALETVGKRKYEGAARGRRTDGWQTSGASPNAEAQGAIELLRDRSRDLVRNNPFASRAVQVIVSNSIGTGIASKLTGPSASQVKKAEDLWRQWAGTSACDAAGEHDFAGLQALAFRTVVESGEVLIRRRPRFSTDGLPVPLQLQLLEPDYIATIKTEEIQGGYIIQGVEFDLLGRRVGYWLYDKHPGEIARAGFLSITPKRIPASEILHLYKVDRIGQVRGICWGAPVIIKLRDFDEYGDSTLLAKKISACFAGFVYDSEPTDTASDQTELPVDRLEPGILETLPPGKKIEFATPPVAADYSDFTRTTLRAIAMGYGVPYEALTGDLSQVNFSSARMGWVEFHRSIEQWRWNMIIPRLCSPVFAWFKDAAELTGAKIGSVSVEWTPPRREMIDPVNEIAAYSNAIRSGLMTLSGVLRESGYDPAAHLQEYSDDQKLLDKLGLTLDSDPRHLTKAGINQVDNNTGAL